MHTIISGIDKLSKSNEKVLSSIGSFEYLKLNERELKRQLNRCDVFWFRLNHNLDSHTLHNIRCKYIICAATGLDHIDTDYCKKNNITLISLKGEYDFLKKIRATAEHTVLLTLMLLRKCKQIHEHVERGMWQRENFCGNELYGKKIGIYGMGRIGKLIAKYYSAFGSSIYYYDLKKDIDVSKKYIRLDSPQKLFSESEIITIHLPLNNSTNQIIDKNLLNNVKNNAYLINTSRGDLINENDLLDFLKSNKIKGYATDVLSGEPNIKSNKIYMYSKANENIIITPHIGGNTHESIEMTETFVLKKLLKFINEKN